MNPLSAVTKYFQGALSELHQVRWPTRNQAIRLSGIVLGFTFVASILYGLVDFLLGEGMSQLLKFV